MFLWLFLYLNWNMIIMQWIELYFISFYFLFQIFNSLFFVQKKQAYGDDGQPTISFNIIICFNWNGDYNLVFIINNRSWIGWVIKL